MNILRRIKLLLGIRFNTISVGSYIRGLYLKKTVETLPVLKFKKILDAGCGDGYYSRWFARKYPTLEIRGYDIEPSHLWKNKPLNLFFRKKDLLKLKENSTYDFCFCIDVLNCIFNNKIVLANICKSLKRGGYLYIHMPSINQKRTLFKKYFREYDPIFNKKFPGELYRPEELKKIINTLGLDIVAVYNTFGLFGRIAWEINTYTNNEGKILLKIFSAPLLKFLSFLECSSTIKDGNGLLLLAQKR